MTLTPPTRDLEVELASRYGLVAGIDEVGRGALAGPVCVGVAVVGVDAPAIPEGLTDSKQLTAKRRVALVPKINDWCIDVAVGEASAAEIDRIGIVPALRLAATRALGLLEGRGVVPDVALLDGCHDWLGAEPDLFAELDPLTPPAVPIPCVTQVKGDMTCAVVSAASVVAKVYRDGLMADVEDDLFDLVGNKGYSSPRHIEALRRFGPSDLHRRSWKLPGVAS